MEYGAADASERHDLIGDALVSAFACGAVTGR